MRLYSLALLSTIYVLFNLNINSAKIVTPSQIDKFAEIYSSIELVCSLADKESLNLVNWRKVNGVK